MKRVKTKVNIQPLSVDIVLIMEALVYPKISKMFVSDPTTLWLDQTKV